MWKPLKKTKLLALSLSLACIGLVSGLSAQTAGCGCQNEVIVLLDDNCEFNLDVSNVQAGDCGVGAYVVVDDGQVANLGVIDCPGTFNYAIFNGDEQICWGRVTAEDKRGPIATDTITVHDTLECHLIDEIMNNAASTRAGEKYYVGEVQFADNCADCGCTVSRTFNDQLFYQDCDTTLATGLTAELLRTWTAIDCNGYRTYAEQRFYFVRPSLDTLHKVEDVTYQTCTPEQQVVITRYPYWIDVFGDRIYLNQMDCNYAATIASQQFPVCGSSGSYKEENYVRVFDWCRGAAVYVDTFVTKVGDFAGPVFTGNARQISSTQVLNSLQNDVDRDSLLRVYYLGQMPSFSTSPTSCGAAIALQLQTLQATMGFGVEDCSTGELSVAIYAYERETIFGFPLTDTSWVATNYAQSSNVAVGLPPGVYAMSLTLSDGCKNSSTGLVYFLVEDKIAPVMKCTDALNVTLTTAHPGQLDQEAYSRIDVADVNSGSFDNCAMGQLKIRRNVVDLASCAAFFIDKGYDGNGDGQIDEQDWYDENGNNTFDPDTEYRWVFKDGSWFTPWRDFAEFFCCDVDQGIVIELGGWDQARHPLTGYLKPNLNYCWQTTVIEDSSVPLLTSLPAVSLRCTDPILGQLTTGPLDGALLDEVRATFGETQPYGIFCGSIIMTEELVDNRDRCGFGSINRIIQVAKQTSGKGVQIASVVQEIRVEEVFDYSICFPADVSYDCTDNGVNIPGVEVNSGACDLFAVNYTEEQFIADPMASACYQIFRTYQVVNWCEYDGISSPVIVGRDWDTWNGCDDTGLGEYNINPLTPGGDGLPGDEGICVIVERDFQDNARDVVYYDRNTNPFDNIPDEGGTVVTEGYWWKVVSGSTDPDDPLYDSGGYGCAAVGVWANDPNDTGANDDDDYRYGSNGLWQYTQHITVIDNQPPTVSLPVLGTLQATDALNCAADIELLIDARDNCSAGLEYEVYVDFDNTGVFLQDRSDKLTDALYQDQLPLGTHRIVVYVHDICGNRAVAEQVVEVRDAVGPSPVCLSGLVVELMPVSGGGAEMEVWASDFVASPIGDCTGQGPQLAPVYNGGQQPVVTDYSINRVGQLVNRDSTGLQVSCADLGQLLSLELHAWDDAGNHDYCTTFLEVQDNNGFCTGASGAGVVAGQIVTPEQVEVEDVEVELSGGRSQVLTSSAAGHFQFDFLREGYDYSVVPQLDKDHLNGISTFDLVLMSQHILGLKRFQSPYQMIAADVNRSGGITTLDLIQLRKLILNLEVDFPNNTSWRFIRADYEFPDPQDPWSAPFPESGNLNNLQGTVTTDFVAIKIGDVNYSARPNSLYDPNPRSVEGTMVLHTADVNLVKGEWYDLPFYANMDDVAGYQFTMELPAEIADLVAVDPVLTREENFGIFRIAGQLTSAFVNVDNPGGEQHLFTLRIRARANVRLSDYLTISSAVTESEAYDFDYNTLELILQVESALPAYEASILLPAYPNPLRESAMVPLYLEQAGKVSIQVQDALGRVVLQTEQQLDKGMHQLPIAGEALGKSGVYYYEVSTEYGFEGRQQLIVLE